MHLPARLCSTPVSTSYSQLNLLNRLACPDKDIASYHELITVPEVKQGGHVYAQKQTSYGLCIFLSRQ
jgi:hypothetical protein